MRTKVLGPALVEFQVKEYGDIVRVLFCEQKAVAASIYGEDTLQFYKTDSNMSKASCLKVNKWLSGYRFVVKPQEWFDALHHKIKAQ